jgi:hypothetical protein
MRALPKHPEAHLWPSEVVTLGLLHALKGVGNRAFYRWLTRDYRARSCTSNLRLILAAGKPGTIPLFTTCARGFCHGLRPLFLPTDADRPSVAVHYTYCISSFDPRCIT